MRFSANTLQVVVLSVCLSVVEIPCATAFGQEKAAAKPSFSLLGTWLGIANYWRRRVILALGRQRR